MRSVISISDLCWDMSAFTSEYVSLMMARNMFFKQKREYICVLKRGVCKQHDKMHYFNTTGVTTRTHHENKENEEDKGCKVNRS